MIKNIRELLSTFFSTIGLKEQLSDILIATIFFASLISITIILFYFLRFIIHAIIKPTFKRRKSKWSEYLYNAKFFSRIAFLIPLLIVKNFIPACFLAKSSGLLFTSTIANISIVFTFTLIINSFLKALTNILSEHSVTKDKPVKSYIQVVSIIIWIVTAILVISALLHKSPTVLLAGIGAFSAILILVFQDSIIGFVNSIQLTTNDLLRNGDWITMPKNNADGTVEEISLTSVKVRNFDNSISTIPVRQVVSDSFQNWRGMQDKGMRRVVKSLYIDITSIKYCTPEEIESIKQIDFMKEYFEHSNSSEVHSKEMINFALLRYYLVEYLKHKEHICLDQTIMAHQLNPTEFGIPLEIYCFTDIIDWVEFEKLQAEIMDHIFTILPKFNIRSFQRDTNKKN